MTICTTNESFKKKKPILKKYKNVFETYGIHPHESKNYINLTVENIKKNILLNRQIIGVGETGLDFYYNHSNKDEQKKCFLKHIRACQETSKTLIVHTRSAENETHDVLKSEFKNKEFKILIHCFTGSKTFAHKLLDIGCYFSASGIITFKKNSSLSDTFKSIPNNRILVETDAPYLSPEPLRGKSNEPSHIIHTLKYIAKIKQLDENKTSAFTSKNFFDLFNLKI